MNKLKRTGVNRCLCGDHTFCPCLRSFSPGTPPTLQRRACTVGEFVCISNARPLTIGRSYRLSLKTNQEEMAAYNEGGKVPFYCLMVKTEAKPGAVRDLLCFSCTDVQQNHGKTIVLVPDGAEKMNFPSTVSMLSFTKAFSALETLLKKQVKLFLRP